MNRVLLDTSVLIELLRGKLDISRLLRHSDKCVISTVVLGELYGGAYRSGNPAKHLEAILGIRRDFTLIDVGAGTALVYGQVKGELTREGRLIPENDIWIAASAIHHSLMLVSLDTHFDRVQKLNHFHAGRGPLPPN